ncbi:MAG TPA: L,D-transpeptidase family protein [Tepidiformaceae bacterium]|jgi:murein L,D-transpeptidase YcbB/YkuD|nr:L,D-transpeptidase family protein [Candidatus Eisenbacteria bacterium]HEX6031730.1 L,D-transpeptidase family protein [Tepidiformaceae bacterium]
MNGFSDANRARPAWRGGALALVLALVLGPGARDAAAGPVEDAIQVRTERLTSGGSLSIAGAPVGSRRLIPLVYERRGYRPAWNVPRLDQLLGSIDDVARDGLIPEDYHRAELRRMRLQMDTDAGKSADATADRDILATDALIGLAYHLYTGKVDPVRLDSKWNFERTIDRQEAADVLLRILDTGQIDSWLQHLRPRHPYYSYLKRELARYRDLAARGGWPAIPAGPTLKLGMRDPRVPSIRKRLEASGDLPPARGADTSRVYDAPLAAAVRSFQRNQLLGDDGSIGPGTLGVMNVPVKARIDQIRVNLERARWLLHDLPDSFVVVNIAAFRVYLVVKGEVVWSSRCVVGKEARQTPIFRDNMRYLVFNPTWTVPPGILARDILPSLRRGDLSVLKRKKLKVIDKNGRIVNPGSVAWSKVNAGAYTFRQDAGPDNALGRVKFMFPNSYAVYLHDTPSRDLFEEPSRAFSSGCIRVDRPLELAERVLADPKWNAAAIRRTVDAGKTTTVTLKRPLPVLLLYWTAFPWGRGGEVAFARDIYGRDARVLKALGGAER